MTQLLWWLPAWLGAVTVAAPILARRTGRRAGYPLAVAVLAAAAAVAVMAPRAIHQPLAVSATWVPQLGARVAFRLDALSVVFALLILGIGALVLWFSPGYLDDEGGHRRYYTGLVGFATAMACLVLADDVLLLYAAWEATTVASFLLIAQRPVGRDAAVRALLVNVVGGLALLAAAVLALVVVGDAPLHELARPQRWPAGARTFLWLVLVAAAVKSAQPPFHRWLPGAMVAPTPVSAYLHAAAMVKAGVYLLLRFAELLSSEPTVALATLVLGTVGAALGAAAALRRDDLKEILAYSTISQLGLMVALVAVGTAATVAAAIVHAVAHAVYKSGLFLVSGVTDHVLGTRDLRELGGVRRTLPVTSGAALLCVASLAGVPPMLGYVSKEQGLKGLIADLASAAGGGWWAVLAGLTAALVLTVAYALRIARPFAVTDGGARRRPSGMALVPALLGLVGLATGLYSARLTEPVRRATVVAVGAPLSDELGLWHGATAAFWTSAAILSAGTIVWLAVRRRPVARPGRSPLGRAGTVVWSWSQRIGALADRPLHASSPMWHLGVAAATTGIVLVSGAFAAGGGVSGPADSAERWGVAALLLISAGAAARARNRLAAVAVVAATGFLVATFFVLHGGADLALTQLVVDALTLALIVFVIRDLPASYPATSPGRAAVAAGVALLVGVGLGTMAHLAAAEGPSDVAAHYLADAPAKGADNVVNAILSDYRALDTLAETTVLATAAIGVVVVIRTRGRQDP